MPWQDSYGDEWERQGIPLLAERRGGRAIKKKFPFRKGADGVVAHRQCFGMPVCNLACERPPVCGASVASRLFINAAATLLRGEESASPATLCAKPSSRGRNDRDPNLLRT